MKLTPDASMKLAKELTLKALENNYIPKSTSVDDAASVLAKFYLMLANELCDDSSNVRIHLEQ